MINFAIWLLYFIPAILIELVCYVSAPIVALFIRTELRYDVVKRLNKKMVTMPRDYLIKPLMYFQTHDNAVDEWWYGMYNVGHWFKFARDWTQSDYDTKSWVRYYCRVMWLWRNSAYGFHYALFSRPKELPLSVHEYGIEDVNFWYKLQLFKSSFQFELQLPLGKRYLSINIGWKAHKFTERLLYANRIISFRAY